MCEVALGKKANDVVILDMKKISGFCDYFVIASAESSRKVKAICEAIVEAMRGKGVRALHTEGKAEALWALVDFGDVVVHIFHHETRKFYDLERLWNEAPKEYIPVKWQELLSKKRSHT